MGRMMDPDIIFTEISEIRPPKHGLISMRIELLDYANVHPKYEAVNPAPATDIPDNAKQ
ncbi:hypothetical protein CpipJ_CPIJ000687 [Culex quinquefasciatus]|uniref:Uncharacterized protein n=1 Tax=Culex quinquefasciatus TaxID=7176 RepID=B0W0L8_CULQU|nr:hypothetical protein CpipJ_CPIJ000687 [Culex quinquefasciatus]|eukprot:XP_001842252.1 hypothetical protein CpipJ_CPIJ000687 [Culex quinquefasciatus]